MNTQALDLISLMHFIEYLLINSHMVWEGIRLITILCRYIWAQYYPNILGADSTLTSLDSQLPY